MSYKRGDVILIRLSYRRRILEAEMIAALKQDAEDPEYQAEISAWDGVVGDGINAEG